jgi:hypothetical protein
MAMGRPVVENARHGGDQSTVIALAGERPANWTARVNAPLAAKEFDRVRVSIERGLPYCEEKCVRETVKDLGLEQTVRPEGRPQRKNSQSEIG